MDSNEPRFEKGLFSSKRLPVSEEYVRESGRWPLFAAGGLGIVILAAVFLGDAFLGRAATVSHGPLSASHALFGNDCASCHTPLQGATNASCAACHGTLGSPVGAYSWEQHYLYRSSDPDRSAPSTSEVSCAACHQEHQGRDASLVSATDATCRSCHVEVEGFPNGHPQFQFAAEEWPDASNLNFPHVLHVSEVMAENELVDVETACLSCHVPESTGASFQPLSFETQCDACHLSQSASTPFLPIRPADGSGPGVATLEQIRASGDPGTLWSQFWNPNEFRTLGDQVQKRPLYHEDPWVLQNLRQIRRELFPGAELADLLTTSADVPLDDAEILPREAIATLREQIRALRGNPSSDVQEELARMTELLDALEGRIANPFAPIDVTRYGVRLADRAGDLPTEEAYHALVDSLTIECQACHRVENATIARVQTSQHTLARAEFDHRSHVSHARCLDCHNAIPVRDALAAGEDELAPELDRSEILNLPTIETCAACHTDRAAPNNCTSCHVFHPDDSHWGNLSRYEGRRR